jgi:hypothetical protein
VPDEAASDPAAISTYDAVRLFVDRARESDPAFEVTGENARAVATLCSALDGVPLAIELAAARLDVETIDDLARDPPSLVARLAHAAAPADRRRSIVAPIEWAVSRLTLDQIDLFRRLATFAGSFTRSAALRFSVEPVRASRGFDRLVRTSLVVRDPLAPDRFRLLAIAREYARSLTSPPQRDVYRTSHARMMLARVEELEPQLRTSQEYSCVQTLKADFADYRAAVEFFIEAGRFSEAARVVVALYQFALLQPRPEVNGWADAVAAGIADDAPRAAEVVGAAALGAWYRGDTAAAVELGERSLAIVAAYGGSPRLARTALIDARGYTNQPEESANHYLELMNLHRQSGDLYWQVGGLVYETIVMCMFGREDSARRRAEQALQLARRLANPSATRWALYGLGRALALTDPAAACVAYEQAMDAAREVDSRFAAALALVEWVELKRRMGAVADAVAGTIDLLDMLAVWGNRSQLSQVLREAGLLLAGAGRAEDAALMLLARQGLPVMRKAEDQAAEEEACLRQLEDLLGDRWTRVSVRAKAVPEYKLVTACRQQLADLRGAR